MKIAVSPFVAPDSPRPQPAAVSSAIILRDLRREYDGYEVVRGVSLEIPEGEIFGLLGPNAAGKTTMLSMISTRIRPTSGDAWVYGKHVVSDVNAVRQLLNVAPQEEALYPSLTGDENRVAAKRQLAQRIRDTHPPQGQPRHLHLTDGEINAIVNSALGRGGARRQASVHFEPSMFAAQASLAVPPRWGRGKFLNVRLAGQLSIDEGRLHLGMQEFQLGSLSAPAILLRMLSSSVYATLMDDPQIRRIIEAIVTMNTEPGAINVVFESGALSRQVVPALVQLLWERPDVAFETGLYLRQLIALNERLPADADRFGLLLQEAFTMAAERSTVQDPLLENRAAIFALAILLGHPDLEPFVGELLDSDLQAQARRMVGTVALRGRRDWTRHFWVSAALVLLSNEATSDRIGLLKEQLDSQDGGSGFSFADMLANAAGTRFAIGAIRDQSSARAMQARLARGFDLDAFFPPADGLPENIPAAEFQKRYGGVSGPRYQAIVDEINRRLDTLPKV
jgi:ABC-type Fe3+/spermidine/putrescine transport system ATPase subunit